MEATDGGKAHPEKTQPGKSQPGKSQPGNSGAFADIATLLKRQAYAEAERAAARLVRQAPDSALAHYLLGVAVQGLGRHADAIRLFNAVLRARPGFLPARGALAPSLEAIGEAHAAFECYHAVLLGAPEDVRARWVGPRVLPRVYQSQAEIALWRQRHAAAVHTLAALPLDTPESLRRAWDGIRLKTGFELAYQAQDDRVLQEAWGGLADRVVAGLFPDLAAPCAAPAIAGRKIRVGFASEHFHNHTIALLFARWITALDRARFEVSVHLLGGASDTTTRTIKAAADRFRDLRDRPVEEAARAIKADGLDVLIHPDVGMGLRGFMVAACRLAPLQCVSWGHPVTSGLPAIDLFLSSGPMEPDGADALYSERLIRLPGLSVQYVPHPPVVPDRPRFGLEDDRAVYLCCQAQQKYLPQYDRLLTDIAARVPGARFVFIDHRTRIATNRQFRQRLETAFRAAGLAPEAHLVFLGWQPWADFHALCASADVFLDTPDWSGGNTTLEAIAQGLPPVTLPGRFMRGRHTHAMLTIMEMDALIAKTARDYVDIAVRLVTDRAFGAAQRKLLTERRGRLFDDPRPVRALEDVLVEELAKLA